MKCSNPLICTLFEGDYYYGVFALINSLYRQEYKGEIYVGYRGKIPQAIFKYKNYKLQKSRRELDIFEIDEDFKVIFLEVNTRSHLAHYKPAFMLDIMKTIAEHATGIIYFDPDIVVKCNFRFINEWIQYGVALVHEIVSSDMPPTHPTRKQWEQIITECGKQTVRKLYSYINCGFCGITRNRLEFLELWAYYIQQAINVYGQDEKLFSTYDRTKSFWSLDQDTFNMTAMSCQSDLCEMGPDAMDFTGGGWTMSHATGSPKPWRKKYISESIMARPPLTADKMYWIYANEPIQCHSPIVFKGKNLLVKVTSFIGRFYRRY